MSIRELIIELMNICDLDMEIYLNNKGNEFDIKAISDEKDSFYVIKGVNE